MLKAYKGLNADDFGDGKSLADTGLDKPEATVTIALKDGAGKYDTARRQDGDGREPLGQARRRRRDLPDHELLGRVGDVRRVEVRRPRPTRAPRRSGGTKVSQRAKK